jgi:hypothetical protein
VAWRLWRPLGLISRGFIQKAFRRGAPNLDRGPQLRGVVSGQWPGPALACGLWLRLRRRVRRAAAAACCVARLVVGAVAVATTYYYAPAPAELAKC